MNNKRSSLKLFLFISLLFLSFPFIAVPDNTWAAKCENGLYSIKASANSGGSVTLSGSPFTNQCVAKDSAITLDVTPDTGYEINYVKLNGKKADLSSTESASVNVKAVSKNTVVQVQFKLKSYTLTVSSTDSDIKISPLPSSGQITRKYNQTVKFILRSKNPDKTPALSVDEEVVDLTKSGSKYTYTLTVTGNHSVSASASGSSDTTQDSLPGNYLLAFHSCDPSTADCSKPNYHYTQIAYSDDGNTWSPLSGFSAFAGSVPDIVRRDDTLYIYNPGTVVPYTISTKTLGSSSTVTIKQQDGTIESFVDPSPYFDSSTNKIVLFYLASTGVTGDPAKCTTCPMRSATEVDGSNGSQFIVDSGDRILVANGTDPDIYYDGSKYILYISKGAQVLVATSTSLKGEYLLVSSLTDGSLTTAGGVPAGHYDSATGQYWTYVHTPTSPSVIKRAVHSDFSKALVESDFTTVISGSSYTGLGSAYTVQSPGFIKNK